MKAQNWWLKTLKNQIKMTEWLFIPKVFSTCFENKIKNIDKSTRVRSSMTVPFYLDGTVILVTVMGGYGVLINKTP